MTSAGDNSAAVPPLRPIQRLLDRVRLTGQGDELLGEVALRLGRRRRRRRAVAQAAVTAVGLAALFAWGVPYWRETAAVATPPAHREQVTLADGSRAELNARTEFETDFRYGRRRIRLVRGEAYFEVTKDAAHPFVVQTPVGEVRVTGTHFNVRLAPAGQMEVTLFEGSVMVRRGEAPTARLLPGQQCEVDSRGATLRTLTPDRLANVTEWRRGRIGLEGVTLAEAAARLGAFHGCAIVVEPAVASIRLGGSYPLDDLSRFLDALRATEAVQVQRQADGSFRILPR